jgi:mRNA interferase HigB
MRIIAKRPLRAFWEQHANAEGPLKAWHADVEKKRWTTPAQVKADYPRASIVANDRVVFNIVGNQYRLIVAIKYQLGIVYVRFIGKHVDYDHIDATTI